MEENLQIIYAMQDDKFKEILQQDEVLNALQREKNNVKDEYFQIIAIISKRFVLAGLNCQPITPAIWAFLYVTGNNFVTNKDKVTEKDIDIFLYLLSHGLKSIDQNLYEKSLNYCPKNGINYQYAEQEILDMILLTFRPLQMYPKINVENPEDVRFNADWLTKIVSLACQTCNKTSDEVMFNMSLCEALYYVVQKCRENDPKGTIKRRNSDEVNEEMFLRTMELGKKYYQENYK